MLISCVVECARLLAVYNMCSMVLLLLAISCLLVFVYYVLLVCDVMCVLVVLVLCMIDV